ncbi:unnamed protein product [Brassica oleracea var. botrytis]
MATPSNLLADLKAYSHKKPTSSAADGITGGSRLTSQTVLRQEVPTATSKSYTFKTSMVI